MEICVPWVALSDLREAEPVVKSDEVGVAGNIIFLSFTSSYTLAALNYHLLRYPSLPPSGKDSSEAPHAMKLGRPQF